MVPASGSNVSPQLKLDGGASVTAAWPIPAWQDSAAEAQRLWKPPKAQMCSQGHTRAGTSLTPADNSALAVLPLT